MLPSQDAFDDAKAKIACTEAAAAAVVHRKEILIENDGMEIMTNKTPQNVDRNNNKNEERISLYGINLQSSPQNI